MSKYRSKGLLQDHKAPLPKKGHPFFIRNEGEKVYTGFPLIQETETDGFIFGAISDFLEPDSEEGCTTGDGYVQAPDGSRAGIVWQIYPNGEKRFTILSESDEKRWGVFNIGFPKPIKTLDDLIDNFKQVLPLIKKHYEDNINILSKKIEPKLYFCLCCGYKTLEEKPSGTYEICHICGWEDDSGDGGANHVTLKEAKENFKKFGISDPEEKSRSYIRKPTEYDIRHPDWESLYYPEEK